MMGNPAGAKRDIAPALNGCVVCDRPGALRYRPGVATSCAPHEVLIRVARVGICGTDMHIFRGKQPFLSYPRVMGHEIAGHVVEAPDGCDFRPGELVCVMPYFSCDKCHACLRGRPNCCVDLEVLGVHRDGALARYIAVPPRFVVKADGVDADAAAMVEFLAIGAHAIRRADVRARERALVVGAGPIGMAVALFARLCGADVTTLDFRQDRLQFCRDVLAIRNVVEADADALARLSEQTDGALFDVVFDATGSSHAMEQGFSYVAHAGRYALVSVVSARISFDDPDFHKREATLLACRNATIEDFGTVLEAMRSGLIPTAAFATHRAPLSDFPSVLPQWIMPEARVIKGLVEC